jgi:hypothetical protein
MLFDINQTLSATMVLFAVIDIIPPLAREGVNT